MIPKSEVFEYNINEKTFYIFSQCHENICEKVYTFFAKTPDIIPSLEYNIK